MGEEICLRKKGKKNVFCLNMLLLRSLQDILNKCSVGHLIHRSRAQRKIWARDCEVSVIRVQRLAMGIDEKAQEEQEGQRGELWGTETFKVATGGGVSKGEKTESRYQTIDWKEQKCRSMQ